MYADGLLCFLWPTLTRWGVAIVDDYDGVGGLANSARFRWRRSAEEWINWSKADLASKGVPVDCTYTIVARPPTR
jgi:hypothetical protein